MSIGHVAPPKPLFKANPAFTSGDQLIRCTPNCCGNAVSWVDGTGTFIHAFNEVTRTSWGASDDGVVLLGQAQLHAWP